MKSLLNSKTLTFYSNSGVKRKLFSADTFAGGDTELLCWGDFDKDYFEYDTTSKKIILKYKTGYGPSIYSGKIGNQNNQTITFACIDIESTIAIGKFDYVFGLKRDTDTFTYKVNVSIYMDNLKLSDASSFYISTGIVNIVVGAYVQNNKHKIILAPSEKMGALGNCTIYSIDNLGVTNVTLNYNSSSTDYVFI